MFVTIIDNIMAEIFENVVELVQSMMSHEEWQRVQKERNKNKQ